MGIHNQSLGIFHSRTRSSGGPHPPWILGWGSEVSAGKINGTGNSKPEKDIASIPEDDWETNCRPGGNPGIRLGIAHHFVQLLVWGGARWVYDIWEEPVSRGVVSPSVQPDSSRPDASKFHKKTDVHARTLRQTENQIYHWTGIPLGLQGPGRGKPLCSPYSVQGHGSLREPTLSMSSLRQTVIGGESDSNAFSLQRAAND